MPKRVDLTERVSVAPYQAVIPANGERNADRRQFVLEICQTTNLSRARES
jgi:hypothetical protein